MRKIFTVTEEATIVTNESKILLETGDKIEINPICEGAILRKAIKVGGQYFIAPSASDNWLIHFVKRLCERFKCAKDVTVVSSIPPGSRPRPLRMFLDEIVPIDQPVPTENKKT